MELTKKMRLTLYFCGDKKSTTYTREHLRHNEEEKREPAGQAPPPTPQGSGRVLIPAQYMSIKAA